MARMVRIILEVPEGTTIKVEKVDGTIDAPGMGLENAVRDYWQHYLSNNSRKIFHAAARIEELNGSGFTLEDIASNLSLEYESVRSLHRTSGRTAKKWRDEKGVQAPVRLDELEYPETTDGIGRRTRYRLPVGVADIVVGLQLLGERGPPDGALAGSNDGRDDG